MIKYVALGANRSDKQACSGGWTRDTRGQALVDLESLHAYPNHYIVAIEIPDPPTPLAMSVERIK